jgi:DNA-binding NarL/FixJ family response regulator
MAISTVLVDDHQVLRDAIKEILVRHPDFQVVGEAGSGPEAVEVCRRLEPELVVMDIGLPGMLNSSPAIECPI